MGRLEVNDIGKYADKQNRRDVSTKIPFLTQYNHVTALTTQKNIMKSTVMSQTHHTTHAHSTDIPFTESPKTKNKKRTHNNIQPSEWAAITQLHLRSHAVVALQTFQLRYVHECPVSMTYFMIADLRPYAIYYYTSSPFGVSRMWNDAVHSIKYVNRAKLIHSAGASQPVESILKHFFYWFYPALVVWSDGYARFR